MTDHVDPARHATGGAEELDGLIRGLYASISFEGGQAPDWDRLESLCVPLTRFIKAGTPVDSSDTAMSLDSFKQKTMDFLGRSALARRGFVEKEVMRRTEIFGRIAHVFSTYVSAHADKPDVPIARGTNSIQLVFHRRRWWLLSVLWDEEA